MTPSESSGSRLAPYWEDGKRVIFHADCLAVMAQMADESVDIVVTSPPYNMGLVPGGNGRGMYPPAVSSKAGRFREGYGVHKDAMPQDEYDEWQRACLAEMWRVARLGVFYNHRPRIEHGRLRTPLSGSYGEGLQVRQVVIWDRGTGIDVNLRAFCTRQEWIIVFAKPAFSLVDHAASGMGDVWRLGVETSVDEHPAPFPVSLPARCISSTNAQSVLDPFMGSGSTLRAAADAGIDGIGIDVEERFCALAVRRLSQASLFGAAS